MNKVFKVIWSEARNAYVVVSEIAKNHGSKSCSTKKLLTMLIATGVMTCASMAPAMADNPAPDDANKGWTLSIEGKVATEIAPGATVDFSGKKDASDKQNIIVRNDGNNVKIELQSELNNVSAIVNGTSRVTLAPSIAGITNGQAQLAIIGDSITLRKGEQGSVQIHGVAAGTADTDAVNFSQLNKAVAGVAKTEDVAVVYDKNKTSLRSTNATGVKENAIALGKGAYAVANSIAIGNGAYTQDGRLTYGQSVALGNGAVTGAKSTSIGSNAVGGREGTITIGANANNGSVYATVIGTDSKLVYATKYSGAAATIVGANSEIKNDKKFYSGVANGIFGSANTIKNSNGVTIQGSGNTVTNAYKDMSGYDFYLGGVFVKKDAGAVGVIGGMNTVSDQIYTNVIGFGNTVAGDAANISHDVFVAGSRNNLSKVSDSIVMGNDNEISDRSNVISLGHENNITANNAVAIGNGASVSSEGGVALGVGSVADRVAGEVGYDPTTGKAYDIENGDAPDYVWKATKGAVSVGIGRETRQITNVAAGSEDTDAVNVAQLKKVNEEALKHSTVTKGDNITVTEGFNADGGKEYKVALDKDITLAGDNGDIVSISGSKGTIWATGGVTAGSVAAGDVFMDGATATVSGLSNTTTAYAGFATTGKAATEEQLKEVATEAGKHTTLVAGDNVQVKEEKTDNGLKYTVSATDTTYTAGNGIAINGENNAISVKLNKDEKNLEVTADGLSLNKDLKGIESVSNGSAKLALNGEAGYAGIVNGKGASVFMQDSTTVINGVVGIDQKGKISGVAEGVADTDAVNVSQLKKVSDTANAGWTLSTNGNATGGTNVTPGAFVDFSGDKNVSVSHDGTKVKVELNKDLVDIESISNGDAKMALNGAAGTAGIINGQGASVYMQGSTTVINSKVSVDKDGKISGVAAGKISADSTDAVNGSQLNAVATEAGKHSKVVNGNNTNVEETTVDGQKVYKVNLNNNIMVGDVTGKYVSISGTNGTIEATGAIATKDRVYADKGAKLADIDVTGNTISNGDAKLALDGAAGTAGIVNGKGASVYMQDGYTVINSKVSFDQNGKISGVAAGVNNDDAVNVSQLKKVEEAAGNANKGWNLATNGVATEATNVKPGDFVDFSGDKNISVSHDGTKVQVELNKNIDVNYVQTNALNAKYNLSVGTANENGTVPFFVNSNGAFYGANGSFVVDKDGKVTATAGEIGNVVLQNGVYTGHSALRDAELFVGDADGNYSQITPKSAKLGQVTIDEKGNIAGVNSIQTNALNAKYNLSVGTANENGIMPFFVNSNGAFYGANNNFSVDKDGKVTATAGEIGNVVLQNGVYTGHSALRDGELFVGDASGNYSQITTKGAKLGKVTVAEDGKISGVAAGAVTADSTDAVNGSQLHAVATEAGKHSKVVNGSNINVEEFDNDGQKIYKVNLNKDIMLGDLTGKYVNISGTNGTIETTGYIATKDRVYADKGAKLADIDVTGDKISNGASSIVMDGSNVKVNDKVTIDQNGKISGVAKGEISNTSTDAINGSQLHQTNENVAALDKRVTANEEAIKQNADKINKLDNRVTKNEKDIAANRTDIDKNKADIKTLDNRVTNVEELAKKHTTVTAGDNITVSEDTNKDGGKEYNVALKNNIDLGDKGSVTTGQTVMNNDGLKVGKDVSVTATAVTAGKTSISDEGVKVGDKTYISADGLNANDQKVTNVKAGDISETSKDAVNGSQLYKTNQEVANNTNRINQLGNRVNKVGAGAAALAALHPMDFDPDDKLTFSAGYGNYGGENAAAIGAYYRPDEKVMFSVGGTVGNGENMVNAGVSFSLDRTNHVSNSRTAMAREILDLRAEVTELKAMVAKGGLGSIAEDKMKIFPDVAENHWAYEYVGKLAAAGIIEGYPDGNFSGDRMMSRYEFAAMLYRAMQKGAQLDSKIINEFAPEMGRIRVDRISGEDGDRDKIERVRVNAVKGERDHYGNKIAKAEAKAK